MEKNNVGEILTTQYDIVLNGFEVGGGSIRIHQPEVQEKIFDLIGFSAEQKKQFEHITTALASNERNFIFWLACCYKIQLITVEP